MPRNLIILALVALGLLDVWLIMQMKARPEHPTHTLPPPAAQILNSCPPGQMIIIWTSSSVISSIQVNFAQKTLGGGSAENRPETDLRARYSGMGSLTDKQLARIGELLAKLPPGERGSNDFNDDYHIAFWKNGSRHVYHYSRNALPEPCRQLLQYLHPILSLKW